jgi:hypothetical protein
LRPGYRVRRHRGLGSSGRTCSHRASGTHVEALPGIRASLNASSLHDLLHARAVADILLRALRILTAYSY